MTWILRLLKLVLHPRRAADLVRAALRNPASIEQRFHRLSGRKVRGAVETGPSEIAALNDALRRAGIALVTRRLDLTEIHRFFERGQYSRRWLYYAGGRDRTVLQKVAEHMIAAELLKLEPGDRYLDVASQGSPAPRIYRRLFGCEVLRQDLAYRPGQHGDRIGGSAESIPLADGAVDKIALHNAFEHFEGSADSGFMREAERLLRPGGRLCILPLFLSSTYAIQTDLRFLPSGAEERFESDAQIHDAPGWSDRHGRFYDIEHLMQRVLAPAPALRVHVVHFENAAGLYAGAHLHYAAIFEKTVVETSPGRRNAQQVVSHVT